MRGTTPGLPGNYPELRSGSTRGRSSSRSDAAARSKNRRAVALLSGAWVAFVKAGHVMTCGSARLEQLKDDATSGFEHAERRESVEGFRRLSAARHPQDPAPIQQAKKTDSQLQFLQTVAKPSRVVRKVEAKPPPKLTRVPFRVSRLMEFCSERELQNQTGHANRGLGLGRAQGRRRQRVGRLRGGRDRPRHH